MSLIQQHVTGKEKYTGYPNKYFYLDVKKKKNYAKLFLIQSWETRPVKDVFADIWWICAQLQANFYNFVLL